MASTTLQPSFPPLHKYQLQFKIENSIMVTKHKF